MGRLSCTSGDDDCAYSVCRKGLIMLDVPIDEKNDHVVRKSSGERIMKIAQTGVKIVSIGEKYNFLKETAAELAEKVIVETEVVNFEIRTRITQSGAFETLLPETKVPFVFSRV